MESSTPEKRLSEEQRDGDRELNDSERRAQDYKYTEKTLSSFRPGLVIPATADRLDNLKLVLESVTEGIIIPKEIVVICDGWQPDMQETNLPRTQIKYISTFKHEPGRQQPRNIGVRNLIDSTHVWFLDSDCLVAPDTLEKYQEAWLMCTAYDRVFIGPYDWMGPDRTTIQPELKNDPRWNMFDKSNPAKSYVGNLGVALGNFSGNLVWPINEFKRVGGFWNELHMGRCEDGELGIRASAMCVPMSLVKDARAYHIHHEVNLPLVYERNKRDVPMINERHPYVEDKGLIVVDRDGKRFDYICSHCGEQVNTNESWPHGEKCHGKPFL